MSFSLSVLLLSLAGVSCSSVSFPSRVSVEARSPAGASEPLYRLGEGDFRRAVDGAVKRVKEFHEIAEWGRQRGIRVWIAGGSATGLAVYEKQRLEQEWRKSKGLPDKYFGGRFTDSYFDIYRSTQDADIVIQGSEKDAVALEAFLQSKFNYLEGSKSVWEVRLLDRTRGSGVGQKDSLLDFDFQNQNSDSFSTGMIELTRPVEGESRIRDLFDWRNQDRPQYLTDLLSGQVRFYRNPRHFETLRAKSGDNPEILSAIRALTKAFQYESTFSEESLRELRQIIHAFRPESTLNPYVKNQIAKNGQKLFWHSPNVERAWNESEALGLRRKLIEFGKAHGANELAEWLNREPLRTLPLQDARGRRTAKELGIDVVAHETKSFLAYENISRSLSGKPNVFISRAESSGEMAMYGDGFYTRIGKEGARGTGLTIRFRVHPDAVEGVDFFVVKPEYVIFRNASAIRVIDESISIKPVDYLRLLASGGFSSSDKGLLEKLKLRVNLESIQLTPEDEKEIKEIIRTALKTQSQWKNGKLPPVLIEWLSTAMARTDEEFLREIATSLKDKSGLIGEPTFARLPEYSSWVKGALRGESAGAVIGRLGEGSFSRHPDLNEWVELGLQYHPEETIQDLLGAHVASLSKLPKFSDWVIRAIESDAKRVCYTILDEPAVYAHNQYPIWIEKVFEKVSAEKEKHGLASLLSGVLAQKDLMVHPKFEGWVDRLHRVPYGISSIIQLAGIQRHPAFPRWMDEVLESDNQLGEISALRFVFHRGEILSLPGSDRWIDKLLQIGADKYSIGDTIEHYFRTTPSVVNQPKFSIWMEKLRDQSLIDFIAALSIESVMHHPKFESWMDQAVELSSDATEVVPAFGRVPKSGLIQGVLSQARYADHPKFGKWMSIMIRKFPEQVINEVFRSELQSRLPEIQKLYAHPSATQWIDGLVKYAPAKAFGLIVSEKVLVDHPKLGVWCRKIVKNGEAHLIQNILAVDAALQGFNLKPEYLTTWLQASQGQPHDRDVKQFLEGKIPLDPSQGARLKEITGLETLSAEGVYHYFREHPWRDCAELVTQP